MFRSNERSYLLTRQDVIPVSAHPIEIQKYLGLLFERVISEDEVDEYLNMKTTRALGAL